MNKDDRRYRGAYHLLHDHITVQLALGHLTGGAKTEAEALLASVEAELNPPEFEEVEECAGWASVNSDECGNPVIGGVYLPGDKDKIPHHPARIEVQEIRVKVKRPVRRAVIREYEVAAKVAEDGDVVGTGNAYPFSAIPECHGKAGVLIFRTAE